MPETTLRKTARTVQDLPIALPSEPTIERASPMNLAPRAPLNLTLTLGDSIDRATPIWTRDHVLADLEPDVLQPLLRLRRTAAADMPLSDLDKVNRHIAEITGASTNRIARRTTEEGRTSSLCLVAATIITVATDRGEDPACALASLSRPRKQHHRECHTDAQILVLRCAAMHRGDRGFHSAAARYALMEVGAWPTEISSAACKHLDDPANPQTIHLTGVDGHLTGRTRPIPEWAQPVIRAAVAAVNRDGSAAADTPLFYRGSAPRDAKATASISTSVRELLRTCGWDCSIGQPLNAARWRTNLIERHEGVTAAARAAGITSNVARVQTFTRHRPSTQAPARRTGPASYVGL